VKSRNAWTLGHDGMKDVRLYAFFSKSVPQFRAHVGQQSEAWGPSRFSSPILVKFRTITESNKPEPASFHLIYKLPETFVIDPFICALQNRRLNLNNNCTALISTDVSRQRILLMNARFKMYNCYSDIGAIYAKVCCN